MAVTPQVKPLPAPMYEKVKPLMSTGVVELAVLPLPSCPSVPRPAQKPCPVGETPQVCAEPSSPVLGWFVVFPLTLASGLGALLLPRRPVTVPETATGPRLGKPPLQLES